MDSFVTPYGLSNSGKEKLQFTLFGGGPKPGCSDRLRVGIIESHNFFCLRSYPGEIAHPNSAYRELSTDVLVLVVRRRKVALHTISHLTPTEAWQSAVSTTSEGRRVSSEVPSDEWSPVVGVCKIWRPCDLRSRSYKGFKVHTYTHARTQGD